MYRKMSIKSKLDLTEKDQIEKEHVNAKVDGYLSPPSDHPSEISKNSINHSNYKRKQTLELINRPSVIKDFANN